MAVETRYGEQYAKYGTEPKELVNVRTLHGRVRCLIDSVEIFNGDSAKSRYFVARLPSACILLARSEVHFDGIDGLGDIDFGNENDPNALINAESLLRAGVADAIQAIDIRRYGWPLWRMLGYAKDPQKPIDLFFTLRDMAEKKGTLTVVLKYVID